MSQTVHPLPRVCSGLQRRMLRLWATVGHRTVIFRRPELLSVTARNSSTTRVSYQIITTMSTLESKGTKDYRGWVLWERFELEPRTGEEADQQFWVVLQPSPASPHQRGQSGGVVHGEVRCGEVGRHPDPRNWVATLRSLTSPPTAGCRLPVCHPRPRYRAPEVLNPWRATVP